MNEKKKWQNNEVFCSGFSRKTGIPSLFTDLGYATIPTFKLRTAHNDSVFVDISVGTLQLTKEQTLCIHIETR